MKLGMYVITKTKFFQIKFELSMSILGKVTIKEAHSNKKFFLYLVNDLLVVYSLLLFAKIGVR